VRRGPFPRTGTAIAAASAAAIVVLTLHPAGARHGLGVSFFCVLCGEFGLANLLRNVVLFAPLGLGLGLALGPVGAAWLAPPLLSAGIELAQVWIPGRNPLLVDWVANSGGGALGVVVAGWVAGRLTDLPGERPGWTALLPVLATTTAVAAVLVGTLAAFRLALPPPPHYIQWTPALGHYETYEGEIREATFGGIPTPSRRYPDAEELEAMLLAGALLRVEFEAGRPPTRLAPIYNIFTEARKEVLVLGARGDDLAVKLPLLAARMRLDRPELRLPGALEGISSGQHLRLEFRLEDDGACMGVTPAATGASMAGDPSLMRASCGIRPTLAQGWTLLLFPGVLPSWALRAVGVLWLMGLAVIPGFFARSVGWAAGIGAAIGILALMGPQWTGSFGWTPFSEAGLLMTSPLAGFAAAHILLQRRRTGSGGSTSVADPQHVAEPPERAAGGPEHGTREGPGQRSGM
jgi:hypothetical protein